MRQHGAPWTNVCCEVPCCAVFRDVISPCSCRMPSMGAMGCKSTDTRQGGGCTPCCMAGRYRLRLSTWLQDPGAAHRSTACVTPSKIPYASSICGLEEGSQVVRRRNLCVSRIWTLKLSSRGRSAHSPVVACTLNGLSSPPPSLDDNKRRVCPCKFSPWSCTQRRAVV